MSFAQTSGVPSLGTLCDWWSRDGPRFPFSPAVRDAVWLGQDARRKTKKGDCTAVRVYWILVGLLFLTHSFLGSVVSSLYTYHRRRMGEEARGERESARFLFVITVVLVGGFPPTQDMRITTCMPNEKRFSMKKLFKQTRTCGLWGC
ncbi:hypothetical protein BT67DRAFT_283227 [Trichocladium antarcticum]|uniref:Uncharacterized protein n=1 Tax=Trichocladium antarcticum TaxID=1450529 RepID=A0AAN6UKZ0_9PEZI|nr:hypothetical protein BT67DRAFT_283227 [Trichocladium antarcticum]